MLAAVFDSLGKQVGQAEFNGIDDQETSFTYSLSVNNDPVHVTCRVSKTVPERADDIHVVIRLILQSEPLPIKELGIERNKLNMIIQFVNKRQGSIITSGPMGSGKTVTMTSALNEIGDDIPVQTIEDPIEIRFNRPNFVQNGLKVDHEKQLSQVLRQNVAALYVGEIRDKITASAFIKHVGTGQLGAATTHANNAIGIVKRLEALGIELKDLATPGILSLIMAQRLEKLLCKSCKVLVTDEILQDQYNSRLANAWDCFDLSTQNGIYTRNPDGCGDCHEGFSGRKLILELIEVGKADRSYIANADWDGWGEYLATRGFSSLDTQLNQLLNDGLICPIEAQSSLVVE